MLTPNTIKPDINRIVKLSKNMFIWGTARPSIINTTFNKKLIAIRGAAI